MANTTNRFGLRAIGKVGQNDDNQGLSEYTVAASTTNAIFFQDPVKASSNGVIVRAIAGETILGGLNGIFYTDSTTNKPTWANNLAAANAATDIEFKFPFGFKELEGIHSRTDFDLKAHQEHSGKKLEKNLLIQKNENSGTV